MICKRGISELPPHALTAANDFEREIWDDIYLAVPKYESFHQSRAVPPQQRDSRAGFPLTPQPRPATFYNLTRAFEWLTQFAVLSIALGVLLFLYGIFS